MNAPAISKHNTASEQLRSFIERIERIEEQQKMLGIDKGEIYKEVKGIGFNPKALKEVIRQRKIDQEKRETFLEEVNAYKRHLGMLPLFDHAGM